MGDKYIRYKSAPPKREYIVYLKSEYRWMFANHPSEREKIFFANGNCCIKVEEKYKEVNKIIDEKIDQLCEYLGSL